jgi:hypothetical protein
VTAIAELRTKADLVSHDGQVVRVVGTYVEKDTRPHGYLMTGSDGKVVESYTIGIIRLEDRTIVDLDLLPSQETAALVKKTVAVVGRLEADPPLATGMAQPLPRPILHDIQSIALSPE